MRISTVPIFTVLFSFLLLGQLLLLLHAAIAHAQSPSFPPTGSAQKYVPPTVLSLVISAKDPNLALALERLERTARVKKVAIGNVFVVGDMQTAGPPVGGKPPAPGRTDLHRALQSFGPNYQFLFRAGVPNPTRLPAERVLDRLNINASPTWIVRYRGNDYVFEGWTDPDKLFTQQGVFLHAD